MDSPSFCWNCGAPLVQGGRFCPGCGTPVETPADDQEPRPPGQIAPPHPPPPRPAGFAGGGGSKPGSSRFGWIAGGVGLAVLATVMFWGGGGGNAGALPPPPTTTLPGDTTPTTLPGDTTPTTVPQTPTTTTAGGTLRDLIPTQIGSFTLVEVAPFPEIVAEGAVEAWDALYRDSGGTVIIHILELWPTGTGALSAFQSFADYLVSAGAEVIFEGPWTQNGQEAGQKFTVHYGDREVVQWTNGRGLFTIVGPHDVAEEFWQNVPGY